MNIKLTIHLLALLVGAASSAKLAAQTTAFTYQGRLSSDGNPGTGLYELRFEVFNDDVAGASLGAVTHQAVQVNDGLFTCTLDFGPGTFTGSDLWLEVGVRPHRSSDPFHIMAPRQHITASPYAVRAREAAGVPAGAITSPMLADGAVTAGKIQPGAVSQLGTPDGSNPAMVRVTNAGEVTIDAAETVAIRANNFTAGLNAVASDLASIAMGINTTATGFVATALGSGTTAGGDYSMSMGRHTQASGFASTAMGQNTTASGTSSTVLGFHSVADGLFSMAAGNQAKALHDGAFVWADAQTAEFNSVRINEFAIRAKNGVRINNAGHGVTLLMLDLERRWEFRQFGVGPSTALELASLDSQGISNKDFILNTTGRMGIGTTVPSFTLHVNGSVAGVGAYRNLSDRRYKKDIQLLTNALETITRLRGVSFDWKRGEHPEMVFDPGRQLGFVAQDLRSVVPEAVSESPDGTLHASYSQVIPFLVEAVKEQQHMLKERGDQIAVLRAELEALKSVVLKLAPQGK